MSEKKATQKSQSFLLREDAIDRIPGFENWKIISLFALLICAGLFIMGLIGGTVSNPEKRDDYPMCALRLVNIKSGEIQAHVWNIIHFVGYFIAALVFPDSWGIIWLWGLSWETFEACIGWNDWCDIAYNTAGIALGVAVRKLLIPAGQKLQVTPSTQ